MPLQRHSGILLHPTSLPGPHGSGDLGPSAYYFVDWLVAASQSLWQVLPLGGIGPGNSPYMSPSAFAGNELLIDLAQLRDAGWLSDADISPDHGFDDYKVNFPAVQSFRISRLRMAASKFFADSRHAAQQRFRTFCYEARNWLDDYALFMALDKEYGGDGKLWQDWPSELAHRQPEALRAVAEKLSEECNFWKYCQWCFYNQWAVLKEYANKRGVEIIGDMPIFVSAHGADVWANQQLFDLDDKRKPRVVAGVPPDFFSATGQHWGNPLYNWPAHAKEGYRWWIDRLIGTLTLCDIVRIDHFRGFESYWEIPATSETAIDGQWKPGPGLALFTALQNALNKRQDQLGDGPRIIAEDLGIITPEVTALRQAAGLPGMRILQFAFDGHSDNLYLPHNFEANTVAYTGTHDNDTTWGWWDTLAPKDQDYVRRYLGIQGEFSVWDMIRVASISVAALSIIPMQDVLGLDTTCRMNLPGCAEGSWEWRFNWSQLAPWHADRLAELTRLHGRIPTRRSDEATQSSSTD
ncbi:MAG: 4-alpha-glucanotransferase [Propionivibrio sp.]|uniref:4-alpha-glucanotransferase n=2 Tax=Propionivibrio sp. TaxID=2212460 RepID=UPI0025DC85E9|nr:4-alpha-glucanotransferase [Propionivibrio sp.]MBL0208045.1 4-alpha-glucanotransferase [Propionivibrio sp.]